MDPITTCETKNYEAHRIKQKKHHIIEFSKDFLYMAPKEKEKVVKLGNHQNQISVYQRT
jgi:hypothetical protein